MGHAVNDDALDVLFRKARTYRDWQDRPVTPQMLMAVYDLFRWGPTTNNTNPARVLFLTSQAAKERLAPHLSKGNVEQTLKAPAVAVVAYDLKFYDHMSKLSSNPHARESWMQKDAHGIEEAAFRSGTLQGAYLMLAARALGLDCGPMSGFSHAGVDKEFFAGTSWKSNFLCNIGYGSEGGMRARYGRLDFDEACKII